ncbi:MAG: hypothetical protein K2N07_08505, partial [Desulfovibrio sp.]|nr:hypothetical protein [Desulfovibrio sp.]
SPVWQAAAARARPWRIPFLSDPPAGDWKFLPPTGCARQNLAAPPCQKDAEAIPPDLSASARELDFKHFPPFFHDIF